MNTKTYREREEPSKSLEEVQIKKLKFADEEQTVLPAAKNSLFLTPLLAKMKKEKLLNASIKPKPTSSTQSMKELEEIKIQVNLQGKYPRHFDEKYENKEGRSKDINMLSNDFMLEEGFRSLPKESMFLFERDDMS